MIEQKFSLEIYHYHYTYFVSIEFQRCSLAYLLQVWNGCVQEGSSRKTGGFLEIFEDALLLCGYVRVRESAKVIKRKTTRPQPAWAFAVR